MGASLFIVTGVSGAGKTDIAKKLRFFMGYDFEVYDMDMILDDYDNFREAGRAWVKIANWHAEIGRKTILCGSLPDYHLTEQELFQKFEHVHYCYLTCSDEERARRLAIRGGSWTPQNIRCANEWDHALKAQAMNSNPPIPVIDTTLTTVEQATEKVWRWIKKTVKN